MSSEHCAGNCLAIIFVCLESCKQNSVTDSFDPGKFFQCFQMSVTGCQTFYMYVFMLTSELSETCMLTFMPELGNLEYGTRLFDLRSTERNSKSTLFASPKSNPQELKSHSLIPF